jgi:hypothetical protein
MTPAIDTSYVQLTMNVNFGNPSWRSCVLFDTELACGGNRQPLDKDTLGTRLQCPQLKTLRSTFLEGNCGL